MNHKMAAMCLCAVLLGGCSSVNVVKNPGPDDNGIRYYRPKPYLLVTPADPTGRMVKLEILELPDYCEEYSVHPKGKKPPGVVLKDGWNLVAVGSPPPPPPPPSPAPAAPPADPTKLPEAVLVAGNVPIGLYESVFDVAGPAKFMKGWRYVGFSPFGGAGPANGTDAQALQNLKNGCPPCVSPGSAMQGPIYGLVFFNGAMTFRQLDEVANNMTCPQYVKPFTPPPAPTPGGPGVGSPSTGPAAPGVSSTPVESAPPTPSPTPPGAGSWNSRQPASLPLDAGVRQTSSTTRRLGSKRAATTTKTSFTTPKAVDSKKLEALEAEVFKSLDYAPTSPATSSSSVPALTPAMSIR